MSDYIFRFPANTPEMTYEVLRGLAGKAAYAARCSAPCCQYRIGSTVRVSSTAGRPAVTVRLYDLDIATIFADEVLFTRTDEPSQATRLWLEKICIDNGIGSSLWRVRRRKSDGPGPLTTRGRAGLLTVEGDRDRPVFGCAYPTDVAGAREGAARLAAYLATPCGSAR